VDFGGQQPCRDERQRPSPPGDRKPLGVGVRGVGHRSRVVSPLVSSVQVLISRLDPGVPLPSYARPGDAGADLVTTADIDIAPGERAVVGTGVAIALPDGYAAFVHPRSGLAARAGLSVVNTPGTIDSGYRGEIKICLINHDQRQPIRLRRGDRIAQLVVQRVEHAVFQEVQELDDSPRGAGGYGSTGGHAVLAATAGDTEE
jgi:dUTP pyrophosphatase